MRFDGFDGLVRLAMRLAFAPPHAASATRPASDATKADTTAMRARPLRDLRRAPILAGGRRWSS
jgi:hypothetical protein